MRYVVVSIYDRAADCFSRPFFAVAVGAAVRSFQDEVNRVSPDNPMNGHADDFDLFELAEFDDHTGKFECLEQPKQLAIGKQVFIPRGE